MKNFRVTCIILFMFLCGCATDARKADSNPEVHEQLRLDYSSLRVARIAAALKYSETFDIVSPVRIEATARRLDPIKLQELAEERMPELPDMFRKVTSEMEILENIQAIRITADDFDVIYFPAGDIQDQLVDIEPSFSGALGYMLDLNQINGINRDFDPEAAVSFGGTQLSDTGPGCIGCFIPLVTCSGCPTDRGVTFDLDDLLIDRLDIDEEIVFPLDVFAIQPGIECDLERT